MAGRTSKYETNVLPNIDKIYEMAVNGCNDKEICEAIDISRTAFYEYLQDECKVKLLDTLKKAREQSVKIVENALFKKATGYDYEEETTEYRVIEGERVEVSRRKFKKHSVPDTAAAIFILKNRMKETYQNSMVDDIGTFNVKIVDDLDGSS